MKGAMEHVGSTCCCTEEHRWALLGVAGRRVAAFHLKIKQLQYRQNENLNVMYLRFK